MQGVGCVYSALPRRLRGAHAAATAPAGLGERPSAEHGRAQQQQATRRSHRRCAEMGRICLQERLDRKRQYGRGSAAHAEPRQGRHAWDVCWSVPYLSGVLQAVVEHRGVAKPPSSSGEAAREEDRPKGDVDEHVEVRGAHRQPRLEQARPLADARSRRLQCAHRVSTPLSQNVEKQRMCAVWEM